MSLLVWPFATRSAALVAICALVGGWLYRLGLRGAGAGQRGWLRTTLNALAAALVGILGGWLLAGYGLGAVAAVAVLFGIPAATIHRLRRAQGSALAVASAWALAAVPAAVLTGAWF